MIDEAVKEARAKLIEDLRGEQYICLLLSEMLGVISDGGALEGCMSLEDALVASSRILKNLARSLEEAGQTLAAWT